MAFIEINATRYYYELHGKGTQPLILIAGYTGDHTVYYPVLDMLAPHFNILVFDNRGIGQTTDDGSVLSAEKMADDIMAMANKLNLHKPHIVGQSMGGTIAQAIASQYADQIGKLVLLTTSAKWRSAMLQALSSLIDLRKANLPFDLQFNAIVPWVFGEAFLSNKDCLEACKQLLLNDPHPQSLENQLRQYGVLTTFDGRKALSKISAPTLIIYGVQDLITLPNESAYLQQHIKHASLLALDCAHVITAEVPEPLGKALLEFLC